MGIDRPVAEPRVRERAEGRDDGAQPPDTRARILDAAERLFAERGFEVVSLRHITAAARVNVASVNYHFGSKEALIDEVIARRIRPINRLRLAKLDRCVAAAGGGALPLVEIVDCFVTPVIDAVRESDHAERLYSRLMSRCLAESVDRFPDVLIEQFTEVIARFVGELSRALPGAAPQVLQLRLLFMAGAMSHALFHVDKLATATGNPGGPPDLATLKGEMVGFIATGLGAAPAPAEPTAGGGGAHP